MLEEPTPPVSPWLQLVTLFGLFIAGGFVGLWLSSWAAPGSGLAAGISGMLLPAAFAGGLLIWSGLEFFFAVVGTIRGQSHDRRPRLALSARSSFVPLSLMLSGAGGFVVGLIPGGQGVLMSVLAYAAAGLIYGAVTSRLAARGYLPAPNPS